MDYAITLIIVFGLWVVFIFGGYFIFSRFVPPQKSGVLIRWLWTLFILSSFSFLVFISPVSVRRYFAVAESWGFWISVGVIIIVGLIIWVSRLTSKKNTE